MPHVLFQCTFLRVFFTWKIQKICSCISRFYLTIWYLRIHEFYFIDRLQGPIQDFPVGGVILFSAKCSQKLYKNEEIWVEREVSKTLLCRSITELDYQNNPPHLPHWKGLTSAWRLMWTRSDSNLLHWNAHVPHLNNLLSWWTIAWFWKRIDAN